MCTNTHDVSPIILATCLANLRLLVFTVKKLWLITRIDPIRALAPPLGHSAHPLGMETSCTISSIWRRLVKFWTCMRVYVYIIYNYTRIKYIIYNL